MPRPPNLPATTLPGEGAADAALIDAAVAQVNTLYYIKGLETARAIGEYLIAHFFAGDPANFHAHGRKHASFRKLAEREDLGPSYTFLWNACAIVEQLRLLPADLREALPLSHHKLLLPVKDEAAKVELAYRAVRHGLSKRALEAEVVELRQQEATASKAGRPPLPGVVKGLTRVSAAVKRATAELVTTASFAAYPPDKARLLLQELDAQIQALQTLQTQVRGALGEGDPQT